MNATEKDPGSTEQERLKAAEELCVQIARILEDARENSEIKVIAYLELALAEAEDRLRDMMKA